jgi:hypothetical protein
MYSYLSTKKKKSELDGIDLHHHDAAEQHEKLETT